MTTQLVRRVLKPVVFARRASCPFGLAAVYDAFWGDLGANPVETITNDTGIWTLRLLAITIAITPIRWLTKWNPLINFRRMIGLFAFFYGDDSLLHLLHPRSVADVRRAVGRHRQAARTSRWASPRSC